MDNEALINLLKSSDRQFWIKPWGDPDLAPEEEQYRFEQPVIPTGFSKQPNGVSVGDILFVHRIKISKLMFVAETLASPVPITAEDIRLNPKCKRWPWNIETRILTPDLAKVWMKHSLKTWSLAKEYSNLHPEDHVSLGSLNFGSDKLRISEGFAKFLMNEIMRLD